ncbi:MarR family winged helix-turn-helix transcriptional regulator [uncultured Sphingomonas sp.]|uniref:MarR family winged helix-turn-helix transcriptional regulator n=1 Tax=uncultured Sphingomonas sp. TaxID=158754 RepID=UPI0035CAABF9
MARSILVLDDFIPYRLSFTSNLVSDSIARIYEVVFGLSIPEWRLIAVAAEEAGITQAAISARTRMDKVTVSRAAIALVNRGLLTRGRNAQDGRSHLLVPTRAGRDLYAQVAPKALELERRIFGRIDAAEVARFVATLRRIDALALEVAEVDAVPE